MAEQFDEPANVYDKRAEGRKRSSSVRTEEVAGAAHYTII
jgi:hypothetical protein